jgi:hypothetical protein
MQKLVKVVSFLSMALFLGSFFAPSLEFHVDIFGLSGVQVQKALSGWELAREIAANIWVPSVNPGYRLCAALYVATNFVAAVGLIVLLASCGVRWRWLSHLMVLATLFNVTLMLANAQMRPRSNA